MSAAEAPTSAPPGPARDDQLTAVLLMVASAVVFGFMAVTIRYASHQLHPFEIAFFRNLFGLLFALPLLLRGGPGLLRTNKLPMYFLRCTIGIVAMLAGFWAIVNLPLAQAVALSYSTPLFVTIGAVLVLGEVVRARRWSAVLIGFIGVLIIVRPTPGAFTPGALVAVLAAVMSASVAISIKFLSRTEPPDAIVLYTTLLWVPMSLLPALFVWEWPTLASWGWVALAGFFGTAAHMCWTRAFRLGDASALTPISFVQLPIVAVLAWLLFDEVITRWTLIGAAVIFAANAYIAHREVRLRRRAITDPEIGPDLHTHR
ncbi:MAG TPA: DMT family transporter [Xanthomonadaceae bacterium]|nr:DMT family transporter [Xanthomonadaceae bacterium]